MHRRHRFLSTSAGVAHKSDHDGVRLNIQSEDELLAAFEDLQGRLGSEVLIAPMAPSGVEMILGARRDPQFGPVVVFGFGGIHAEILRDVGFALPPFDKMHAHNMLKRLKMTELLRGVRGAAPADVEKLCEMASRFSAMVYTLRDEISEIDINPLIVSNDSCIAVDALVVGINQR